MSILVALRFLFVTPTPLICFNHFVISQICRRQSLLKGSEFRLFSLVGLSGLEPPTSRLSGGRSNRLSYKPIYFPAWFSTQAFDELSVLVALRFLFVTPTPLTCSTIFGLFHSLVVVSRYSKAPCLGLSLLVEISGIEPLTPCLQSRCSPS